MRVDVHAHLWSQAYLDLLTRLGNDRAAEQGRLGAGTTEAELDARFEQMTTAGVDLQVLSTTPAPPHFENESAAVEAARFVNDEYARLVQEHPGRFKAFASLPLPHTDAALAELGRAVDELGFLGVAITTSVLGRTLADPAFLPVYEELDRRGSVLFVHPAGVGAASPLIGPELTWQIGAPIEDTVAVMHLIVAGIPSRFPRMKIVLPHLGGALPMLLPRIDRQNPWEAPETPELPSLAARRIFYDTVGHNHIPALRLAAETLGADRLVLGSDFPYQKGDGFTEAVTYVQRSGLPENDVTNILDRTAVDLLGLGTD
ncbi:amidohydrolase family protein [Amycolatopsis rhabdoformis]|uniref:Amidohydrolase family protein n=1 Tax=Amycolatopsis rhabdoformis TaxID=1448059 RepID=A0ABZ1IB75_9PSEU|nr:amidohydrolase family protein [Amycolatopsis rhabdoformis]WSE30814.1 amidohydrolase family protein [Amycolatopsis rhabdoformis]